MLDKLIASRYHITILFKKIKNNTLTKKEGE
jgi:hypothetical protein